VTTTSPDVSIKTALERAKICDGLEPTLLSSLATLFKPVNFASGTQFIKHDSQSKDIFIIVNGVVEIEIPVVGKTTNSALARLKPGDSVGEFALLRDARRSATARAINDVSAVVANGDEILKMFDLQPAMGYCVCRNLGRILADRLTDTNMQLRSELSRS
jgi:CRP/FNR family cyclic AMP-dependent transcriptional regulator